MMEKAAQIRGTGIAKRNPEYLKKKISESNAVIATFNDSVIGFCYIENWENQQYVANSGLIIHPNFRNLGLAKRIKTEIFKLSKEKFPNSKLFGITTSLAVMKINSDLGYKPVTFSELTKVENFWNGCISCVNYDILQRTERKMCLCTGMVCNPQNEKHSREEQSNSWSIFLQFLNKSIQKKSKKKTYEKQ
ncbi:MAG: GNAT family N-acetyltransferase [Fluviicola sp.]